ncbi:MAG: DUF2666 family protein [Candidatus Micrarchaeia archaeon]
MDPEEYIDFMAKYKDWKAEDTLKIKEDTEKGEIVLHLIKIKNEIFEKTYSALGIEISSLDKIADSICKESKEFDEAMKKVEDIKTKKEIEEACGSMKLIGIAENYVISKVLNAKGFRVIVNVEDINRCLKNDIKVSK